MLAWMDLEMTGLDPARHVIVEIATLLTGDDLRVIAEGPDIVVHATRQGTRADGRRGAWPCTRGRGSSLRSSHHRLRSPRPASRRWLSSERTFAEPRSVPLCGNSIGDRPALPGAAAARDRELPPLPVHRRVERQGAVPALVSRGPRRCAAQAGGASSARATSASRLRSLRTTGRRSSSTGSHLRSQR